MFVTSNLRRSGKFLKSMIFFEHDPDDLDEKIKIVRFLRKDKYYDYNNIVANELILTDKYNVVSIIYVHRRYQIRFYSEIKKKNREYLIFTTIKIFRIFIILYFRIYRFLDVIWNLCEHHNRYL